jgi:hypothetical protein
MSIAQLPNSRVGYSGSKAMSGIVIGGGRCLRAVSKLSTPSATFLRLVVHWVRRAASRAACTAGKSSDTSTPMIAITTNSSTKVKPRCGCITGRVRIVAFSSLENRKVLLKIPVAARRAA